MDYSRAFAPFDAAESYAKGLQIRHAREADEQQKAERQALGNVFADGTPDRAKLGDLFKVNPEMGFKVQQYLGSLDTASREREAAKWKIAAPLLVQAKQLPYEQRRSFIQQAAPALLANGWSDAEIASFDPTDERVSALSSLAMTVDQVTEANKLQWHQIGEQGSFATDQMGNPVGQGNPFAAQQPGQVAEQPQRPGTVSDVFKSLIQQESGGRPGIRGQQTAYGVPLGMTQMLPETAQAMAQKLGVQFSPDMLTGTSPEAAAMQQKLGRAYFDEGLQKYGGNVEKALMYYHGGPDEKKWGPKTRTYAKAVLARTQKSIRKVSSRQERDGLRSGTQYLAPDGSLRTKS